MLVYDPSMPSTSPTSLAVSDAITQYRQLCELSRDDLSYVVSERGYSVSAEDIRQMENRERSVTVDDLVAIAYALDTTPAVLLAHIPIDMPDPEGSLATGLPDDLSQPELRAWIEGRTVLDRPSRACWWQKYVSCLNVASVHHDDQLQGARAELRDLGELAEREEDAPPVQRLYCHIRESEHALCQAELALALAERQLNGLKDSAS
ncbi:helix-turn-helix domain-containing protein [Amycolatopsis saalfeldensis]|uniref:HTH cro/C1-type domain-containing protein n=1 Tax=Amycolatopsis saalfeldensis TaxID=394193 RepID=A0A1H8YQD0_9PSEU|nr:helix-turn-helix transcriptional regulator [Amycolatopsis saalfeldensis]SEP54377.1 hypothetical protein SAMN04489732_1452 [Amycolatopsis saalfeldensis]